MEIRPVQSNVIPFVAKGSIARRIAPNVVRFASAEGEPQKSLPRKIYDGYRSLPRAAKIPADVGLAVVSFKFVPFVGLWLGLVFGAKAAVGAYDAYQDFRDGKNEK